MRTALVLFGMLVAFSGLARLSHEAAWVDPLDGTECESYRIGTYELAVCADQVRP